MFKLVSEDRHRKSAVLQIVRKSVASGRAGVAECTSSIMSTARLVVRLAGLDELTSGADACMPVFGLEEDILSICCDCISYT